MQDEWSNAAPFDAVAVVAPHPRAAGALRIPSVLRCALLILAVRTSLKIRGFARTVAWIRRRLETVPQPVSADADAVKAAEQAVAMAGAFYPGRAKCLEQSLTLYYLLRRQGVPVRYCHGVQFHPFTGHAWIEYRGKVINDVAEHVKHFTRLPDQLP